MRTTPRRVNGVVAGFLPLDVKINMCNSSDPDEGDSLKFNVNWGDGFQTGQHHPGAGTDPEDGGPATGCGGPGCCRHRHRFDSAGTFTVTAEVSDKHLEDQSGDVSALAISTATFTVKAGSAPEPDTGFGTGTAGSHTTLFASNNGFAGNTFDVQVTTPLQITSFDVNLNNAGSTNTIAIYWRAGTSVGNQSSAAGWTLLGTDSGVVSAGDNGASGVNVGGLILQTGQVYGFYVDIQGYTGATLLRYTNGGPTTFTNADISITTQFGKGNPAFTGRNFFPRQWNGTIHYVK